jgi:hypothetical protein
MIDGLISFLSALLAVLLGLYVTQYLPGYVRKKGENLATREDIEEITKKIESVKDEYARGMAEVQAHLSAQVHNHSFRYEKEFEVLSELSALLGDLDLHGNALIRSHIQPRAQVKSEHLVEERMKAVHVFQDMRGNLSQHTLKYRPFYHPDIFVTVGEVIVASDSIICSAVATNIRESKDDVRWEQEQDMIEEQFYKMCKAHVGK